MTFVEEDYIALLLMKTEPLWFLDYIGGWACFSVSILMIGFLTAIIGDVAAHFGCTIGLKDAVTAISFVAMGTSIPGRFSSWVCFDFTVAHERALIPVTLPVSRPVPPVYHMWSNLNYVATHPRHWILNVSYVFTL